MLCKIADLFTEVPATGGMTSRCREYLCSQTQNPDIIIDEERYNSDSYPLLSFEDRIYMESGFQFYGNLLRFNGLMLHASAIELNGKAYLFSGPCGIGKSTHTRLWQQVFGSNAHIFNDDKPALRRLDGTWYAYGTPWCGKDGININTKASLSGICFLVQSTEISIRQLSPQDALTKVVQQTLYRFKKTDNLDRMLSHIDSLIQSVPIFELKNRPEPEAAFLSYETMHRAAQEAGL